MTEYVWLNEMSQQFLERDYLAQGQTVDERVTVICEAAERILNKPGFAEKFKEYFALGYYSFSTPIWTNFGNERGTPISCFGSYLDDTMESILYSHAEVGMMSKIGGGTSGYFGSLRGRGAEIKGNGVSSGAVHFMQLFDTGINVISQGSTRRGSFAGYLPIEHDDIEEFLTIRSEGSPIQDLSFGVTVTDAWFKSMIDGDTKKRSIWAKVLSSRSRTGYPYVMWIDNANRGRPDVYKDLDMKIHASNLCVTGDQRVVTSNGMRTVKDLYNTGKSLTLFDGEKSVTASPMKLIEKNARILKITTKSGRTHRVTDYHKIKTTTGMIEAKNLIVGDKAVIQTQEGLFGNLHDPKTAFLLGLYHGDGTQNKNTVCIDVWENDFDLIQEIETSINDFYTNNDLLSYAIEVPNVGTSFRSTTIPTFSNCVVSMGNVQKKRLQSNKLMGFGFIKGVIPQWVWDGDKETQAQYLRGLYFADGTVSNNNSPGNPISLSLASINKSHLSDVQMMLSNHGIKSQIYILREDGATSLPNGRGDYEMYDTKTCYRLVITNKTDALKFEKMTGFLTRKNVIIEDRDYRDNTKKSDEIISIEEDGYEDVYCTTVNSDEHVWVCNSFITSNCTEIMLPSSVSESFVCCLSSMNILKFDEWKNTNAVELMVYFLDAVLTEFIEKCRGIMFMERAVRFAERHRAIGIGWFGWHSYLQANGIAFDSEESEDVNKKIGRFMQKRGIAASKEMAEIYGEPDVLLGYGRRHTTLFAIAPTKSSAFIIGQASEGVEPERGNVYIKDSAKGKFTIRNPYLEKVLDYYGKNDRDTWNDILKNAGSVQHLPFLSEHEKSVFKTFREISPQAIIKQAADRQRYIDQGQSVNLLISPTTPVKEVNQLMISAWELGIKSLYYQINVNAAQEFSRELTCSACEA